MSDRGSATVALLAVVAVVVVLAAGLGAVAELIVARARAAAAADAAALAAAPVTFRAFGARGGPAAEAQRFARSNGARLVSCRCPVDRSWNRRVVRVVVVRPLRLPVLGRIDVRAAAAAEFTPTALVQDSRRQRRSR